MRWDEYVRSRRAKALPVIGSLSLFKKLWREHNEITEFSAKSHYKCDECGKFKALKDRIAHQMDP
eukprot:1095507-Pleurochrysis_carterae.AAC.1